MESSRVAPKPAPAWTFALLVLPYSVVSNGFVNTALSYLLRVDGLSLDRAATEISLLGLPITLYFLWSPLTDFIMRRRSWLLVSAGTAGLALFAVFQLKSFASLLATVLLFFAAAVGALVSACVGGLIADRVGEAQRTRVSGMQQVGILGGGTLGGGCILFLAQHISRPLTGVACLLIVAVPALLALTIDEPRRPSTGASLVGELRQIGAEFHHTFWSWSALPILLLLVAPFGTGAALGLLPGLATDYHVSGGQVVWMNGLLGGLLTAAGAYAGSFIPVRWDRRVSYASICVINATTLGILCLGSPRPSTYFLGVTLYLFTIGACYTMYAALIFDLMGTAGRSGSSRYTILNSLGNVPVVYMAWIDGRGYHFFGPRGLPATEAIVGVFCSLGFLAWLLLKKPAPQSIAAPFDSALEAP
jgi:MFS transporter, PAT family, beta-lactamase induction signal transducer AmpG